MTTLNYNISRLSKNITMTLFISIFTAAGIMANVIPQISWQNAELNLDFGNTTLAQNVPDDTQLKNYAQAVLEIETLRKPTLNKIESLVGKDKTSQLACNQQNTIDQLPDEARNLATNYCNQSEEIVKKYGFTNKSFNEMTLTIQGNPTLKQKVQSFMR